MNWTLFICGLVLFLCNTIDLLYTSFSARGSGLITRSTTKAIAAVFVFASKRLRWPGLLNYTGLSLVCYTLLQWVLLAWTANFLMVLSDEQSILFSQTKAPAGTLDKIYVVGYTLSTLGNGDFIGGSPLWKIYISVASFMGLILLTVALSYLLQVLSGVIKKRVFGSLVFSLGHTPEKLLRSGWNGKDLSRLNGHLMQLNNQVTEMSEIHLAYPVLHFYYISEREKSLPVAVAVLDEALTIVDTAVLKEQWPDPLVLQTARHAVTGLLHTLENSFIKKSKNAPPAPSLLLLAQCGISLASDDHFRAAFAEIAERRKLLSGWLQDQGRSWRDVYHSGGE